MKLLCSFFALASITAPLAMSNASNTGAPRHSVDATDHGPLIQISESRGSMFANDPSGKPLFVAALRDVAPEKGSRISLLVFDLEKGTSAQYFFPDEESMNGDSYSLFVSSRGRLYLSVDGRLFEFDLGSRKILHTEEALPGPAMAMDEAPDGTIYLATYPTSDLFQYDPSKSVLTKVVKLDPGEKYPTSMGIDSKGWIYVGLGTVNSNLVAYDPKTLTLKSLCKPEERGHGAAEVVKMRNGEVYGLKKKTSGWSRLLEGTEEAAPAYTPPPFSERLASMYWLRKRWESPSGAKVESFSLDDRKLTWSNAEGDTQTLNFDYNTAGAMISSLTASNGAIYGNTAHPMFLWKFDPVAGKKEVLGHIPKIGGGNFPKLVAWKDLIVGNAYSRGDFYIYQPSKPFSADADPNPALVASSSPEIRRPRGLLAHPDGRHVVSTGFPSYGKVGGGMMIYDMIDRERVALLSSEKLIPDQTIVAMTPLPGGNLILGSSISTPGGAVPKATEAVLGEFDWENRKILSTNVPIAGAKTITGISTLNNGTICGITDEGNYFIFDPRSRTATRIKDFSDDAPAGSRADTSFIRLSSGKLILVMRRSVFEISEDGREVKKLADLPVAVSNIGPEIDGRVYYSCGSHLWSFQLPAHLLN